MNRTGAAGRKGVPAATVVAFLDHYTYDDADTRRKRINGVLVTDSHVRAIRRWRNGHVDYVSVKGLASVLATYEFSLPWFHKWCRLHRKPIT